MKLVLCGLCLPLLSLAAALPDEVLERGAISKVILSINEHSADRFLGLPPIITPDADISEFTPFIELHQRMHDASDRPWSEISRPKISIRRIRFLTPEVALVDGVDAQLGQGGNRTPLLFVMKKVGLDWRIAAIRIVRASPYSTPRAIPLESESR